MSKTCRHGWTTETGVCPTCISDREAMDKRIKESFAPQIERLQRKMEEEIWKRCPSCAAKDAEIARLREAVEFATRNNVGQVIDSEFARNVRKMAGMEG